MTHVWPLIFKDSIDWLISSMLHEEKAAVVGLIAAWLSVPMHQNYMTFLTHKTCFEQFRPLMGFQVSLFWTLNWQSVKAVMQASEPW